MDLKENIINFFIILALLRGPIAWTCGPDLARVPLIEDPRTTGSIKHKSVSPNWQSSLILVKLFCFFFII